MGIQRSAVAIGITVALGLSGCTAPGLWVYEPAGASVSTQAGGAFDAVSYVDGIWSSKVLPLMSEQGVDAATLLPAVASDPAAAAEQYGVASPSGSAPTFLIKGTGTVTKVNTTVPQGPVTVDVDGQAVNIITGPVITGTALRDAAGIGFGEFANQIDFQNVSTELNNRVKNDVVAGVDLASLEGRTVSFEGAFTLLAPGQVNVIPTKLEVTG